MTGAAAAAARRWLTPLELGLLGGIWGASFLFMRIAAGDFGAFALVEMRLALGALVLLPFSWRSLPQIGARLWVTLGAIALINTAVPFVLYAWAARAHGPRCWSELWARSCTGRERICRAGI